MTGSRMLGGEPHEVGRFADEQRIGQHDGGARPPPGHGAECRANLMGEPASTTSLCSLSVRATSAISFVRGA